MQEYTDLILSQVYGIIHIYSYVYIYNAFIALDALLRKLDTTEQSKKKKKKNLFLQPKDNR